MGHSDANGNGVVIGPTDQQREAARILGQDVAWDRANLADAEYVFGISERSMPRQDRGDRIALLMQVVRDQAQFERKQLELDGILIRSRIALLFREKRPSAEIFAAAKAACPPHSVIDVRKVVEDETRFQMSWMKRPRYVQRRR